MYFIYTTVLYLLLPLVLLRLLWLGRKNPGYRLRWRERLGYVQALNSGRPVVWIHAVSVGEVQVARPLIEALRKHYPDYQILITTVTPTGSEMVAQIFGTTVAHYYFPYDLPFVLMRFLDRVRPRLVLILETEIWPNLYRHCRKAGIPLLLLNARLSERSFNGYRMSSWLTGKTLRDAVLIGAQTTLDASRFIKVGAARDKVIVTGNLKFDISITPAVIEQGRHIRQQIADNRPVWIAASTHQGEEALILDAFTVICRSLPDCLIIIAPRHPERFRMVQDLCLKRGFRTACFSASTVDSKDAQILLLDVLGQLPAYYAAADIAFVGGSLVPVGGHNMLEPACLGIPIISGPHLFNFGEIAALLGNVGALIRVDNTEQLGRKVLDLFADSGQRTNMGLSARRVVKENQGSIDRVVKLVQQYL